MMMNGDFVLKVAMRHPAHALRPNGRAHWAVRARAVREARGRARLVMVCRLRELQEACLLPEGWSPDRYVVRWFYKGRQPDADNCLAACKAYLDGCADALGLDDSALECACIERVRDFENTGTVELLFFRC